MNNQNDSLLVFTGHNPEGVAQFSYANVIVTDAIAQQVSDAFEGASMNKKVANFMRGLNSNNHIICSENAELITNPDTIVYSVTAGGMIDSMYNPITIKELVDAYLGKENGLDSDDEYITMFKNILARHKILSSKKTPENGEIIA